MLCIKRHNREHCCQCPLLYGLSCYETSTLTQLRIEGRTFTLTHVFLLFCRHGDKDVVRIVLAYCRVGLNGGDDSFLIHGISFRQ
ncbi:MAG: hypothetical protein [Podoviridae sp. ctbj_2]|nr:MAG: hypothetical protein [Podoviridae sp. ctbj_2]